MLSYSLCRLYIALGLLAQLTLGALIPDTTNGFHFFLVFDYTIRDGYMANGENLGAHNYEFLWGASQDMLKQYKKTNPNMANGYYIPFSRDPDNRKISWWKKHHPSWVLYACDQKTPAALEGDPDGGIVLDITNPEVIAWQVSTYAKPAGKAGYTFIAADNFALGNAVNGCGIWNGKTWKPMYSGNFTDDNYARDVSAWLKNYRNAIKALSPSLNLAVNFVIGGEDPASPQISAVTENLDLVLDEAGFTQWGGGLNDETTWLNILNYVELLQSKGKAYCGINEWAVVTTDIKNYAMASYLLAKNGASAVVVTGIQDYGDETYMAEYDNLKVGSPLAPKYKSNGLWWRSYSNGLSVVNAGTENVAFTITTDSIDAQGVRYPAGSSFTMGPQKGMAFAYTAPPPTPTPTPKPTSTPTPKPTSTPTPQPPTNYAVEQGTSGWLPYGTGYSVVSTGCQEGTKCIQLSTPNNKTTKGAYQTIVLNQATLSPIKISGYARTNGTVTATKGAFSVYADVLLMDGTWAYGYQAMFDKSTPTWTQKSVVITKGPINKIILYCLFRTMEGTVYFDNISVGPAN